MPIRRKRASRKPRRNNRKPRMGGRMGRSAGPSLAASGRNQFASIVETIKDIDGAYLPNTPYGETFSLADFNRAKALATNFQYYRAKSVTYTYEPLYNTFQAGGSSTKPYIYLMMNRTQLNYAGGLDEIQHSGGRPKAFTSLHKVTYKPNWCSPGLIATDHDNPVNGAAQLGSMKQFGWLTCPTLDFGANDANDVLDSALNPSSNYTEPIVVVTNNVKYNGHLVFIDQPGNDQPVARVTIQVHWEFKGAHYQPTKGSANFPPSITETITKIV